MAVVTAGPLSSDAVAYFDANVGNGSPLSPDGSAYLDANVGLFTPLSPDGIAYLDANVGLAQGILITDAVAYMEENVGLALVPVVSDAVGYLDLGDVTTDVPVPYLWFITPSEARPGDPLKIFCAGAGSDITKCSVERYHKDADTWTPVQITSLVSVPAQPEGFTDQRYIDPVNGTNVEHCEIYLYVPVDAPANERLLLRVRTNL